MAEPSSVLSQAMRSISLTKIRELEKQRDKYESRKARLLDTVDGHPDDISKRITQLLDGVKTLCEREIERDYQVQNMDLWLQQSSYDASLPPQKLQSYEARLRSKLDIQSRKLGIGNLWSCLVAEWMDTSTPMGEAPDAGDESGEAARQEKRLKELCDKFEEVVFTPLETDGARIERYMQDLFGGDEGDKALKTLRGRIRSREEELLGARRPFDRAVLRWCVNGLLAEDLLSDEKQAVLRDFLDNRVVLDEIADVLNMRFADFDNWSWEAGERGIPVLPRPQLNGKYRIWMDEDVLQAIFIHYVGIRNCVDLKGALARFLGHRDGPWRRSAGGKMSGVDTVRYEYFAGENLGSDSTVDKTRFASYESSFFLSQLPEAVTTIGKSRAYANDGDVQDDDGEGPKQGDSKTENVNIKQKLLRTLATEAIVHRTLYGEAAVIQSDLQWYATGLSHATIFAVMRFLGYSERMVSFYRKVLQAPLNMVSTPGGSPSGEPRIRQRGVPMAHAPEKLTGEMILFIMDLAVNKATGMLLYRLHDDLFLCGEPQRCAEAWKEMGEFADVMGVEFNKNKTGSVYLTNPEKARDDEIEATLPEGVVRIGHLLLDQDSGEWVLDQDQIDEHVAQLRRQLAACDSVLGWVKTWNSCISRFFSHTLGEPAYCFGLKHVESVLQVYQRIQRVLFETPSQSPENDEKQSGTGGNVVDYLKSKIKERFGVSEVPDAFIFLPEQMGGLGVKNPFIPYLAFRNRFLENKSDLSPESIMRTYLANEKEEYDNARKALGKLETAEDRLSRLRGLYPDSLRFKYARLVLEDVLTSGGSGFFSFEEYTRHRESTSRHLNVAYRKLLEVPDQRGVKAEPEFVTWALIDAGLDGWDGPRRLQVEWVLQLYQDELNERWGGPKLIDEKYLPTGLLTMMRRKAVQWTMVL
ncbi:hypothetical protein SAMD00023353_3400220 [Rosellinia necatrix]|uniref:Reverse transcriptase n=1 Tax=Rosellinia necatrix TaxID=77044 RepID=A0A1W2TKY5_ROSNE|nr:hypothetical protein SAMD00023353_3400220 [Rosellinia necatrix]